MNDQEAMRLWPEPGLDQAATQKAALAIIASQASRGRDIAPPQLLVLMAEATHLSPDQTWLLRAFCSAMIVEQRLPPPPGYWPDARQSETPSWMQQP